MSTIRAAADTIRASLDALPEAVRGTWEPNYGANAVHPSGLPTYHIARCRHARTTAYLATMASPDVAAALADLLEAQDAVQRAASRSCRLNGGNSSNAETAPSTPLPTPSPGGDSSE